MIFRAQEICLGAASREGVLPNEFRGGSDARRGFALTAHQNLELVQPAPGDRPPIVVDDLAFDLMNVYAGFRQDEAADP